MAYLQSMKKRWPIMAGMAVFIAASACMNAFGGLFLPPLALALCVLGVWLPGRVLAEAVGAKRFGLLQTASFVFGMLAFAHGGPSGCRGFWLPRGWPGFGQNAGRCLQPCARQTGPGKAGCVRLCCACWRCTVWAARFALPCPLRRAAPWCPSRIFSGTWAMRKAFFWGFPRRICAFQVIP